MQTNQRRRKRLLGYTDRLTVRPQQKIEFKVSAEGNSRYSAQLVRLINGDIYSSAASFKEAVIDASINGQYDGREQPIALGSYVAIEHGARLNQAREKTIAINFMPTAPLHGQQHLISCWDSRAKAGWSLCIDEKGRLSFIAGDGQGSLSAVAIEQPLEAGVWHTAAVRVSWLTSSVSLMLAKRRMPRTTMDVVGSVVSNNLSNPPEAIPPLMIAAAFGGRMPNGRIVPAGCFNGRLEAPVIYRGILSGSELSQVMAGERPTELRDSVIADWDFAAEISTTRIVDSSANKLDGRIHNMPLRAVKGTRWNGSTMEWPHASDHYAAIHFHGDDLYDCGWQTDITYQVPSELRSGVYALRLHAYAEDRSLEAIDDTEYLPFFVASAKGKPQAKAAIIIPTYTYVAYGNMRALESIRKLARLSEQEFYQRYTTGPGSREYAVMIEEHPELGCSTYDHHIDGSPVHFSSWLRPLLNMRPKSFLWTFCADLLLIDWLEAKSFSYDVITDDLLQEEGVDLLKNYNVILSGNHPEYQTTQGLDAIESYLAQGGRFMYLGGNGYYWRIAVHSELPGVIELRRGLTGTGAWQSEVGENCLAFSGEVGGIWRDLGRPPQQQFGVGFIAQGSHSSYYRIVPEARQSRAAFILQGVEGEIIGDFGIFNGGAAGQEIDKTNTKRGTPPHTIVVARSEDHGPKMVYVIEEMKPGKPLVEAYRSLTHAEVTFLETDNGGAVFAVGSMAWCGSLSHNNYANSISSITANVLNRFCDARPFS